MWTVFALLVLGGLWIGVWRDLRRQRVILVQMAADLIVMRQALQAREGREQQRQAAREADLAAAGLTDGRTPLRDRLRARAQKGTR